LQAGWRLRVALGLAVEFVQPERQSIVVPASHIVKITGDLHMLRTATMIALGAFAFGLGSNALSIAQSTSNFEKKNFNYNEWTKGKFSEVVTVKTPENSFFSLELAQNERVMEKSFTKAISWSSAGTPT
jgi:hypothetical protein